MTDEKLIEKFLDIISDGRSALRDKCFDSHWTPHIETMLSVIRTHYDLVEKGKVHEYAALCQGCGGVGSILKISSDAEEEYAIVCPDCHGHGIVKIEKK